MLSFLMSNYTRRNLIEEVYYPDSEIPIIFLMKSIRVVSAQNVKFDLNDGATMTKGIKTL